MLTINIKSSDCVTIPPTPTLFLCGSLPFRSADITPRSHLSGQTTPKLVDYYFSVLFIAFISANTTHITHTHSAHRVNKTIWRLPARRRALLGPASPSACGRPVRRVARKTDFGPRSSRNSVEYTITAHGHSRPTHACGARFYVGTRKKYKLRIPQ